MQIYHVQQANLSFLAAPVTKCGQSNASLPSSSIRYCSTKSPKSTKP